MGVHLIDLTRGLKTLSIAFAAFGWTLTLMALMLRWNGLLYSVEALACLALLLFVAATVCTVTGVSIGIYLGLNGSHSRKD